jgi:hypothetical protein
MNLVALGALATAMFVAVLGRLVFGGWLSHVSVFGLVWAAVLGLQSVRFVAADEMSPAAGAWVIGALIAYLLGAILLPLLEVASGAQGGGSSFGDMGGRRTAPGRGLCGAVAVLSAIGFTAVTGRLWSLFGYLSSPARVVTGSSEVYALKMLGIQEEGIPYLAAASLAGACVAGWGVRRGLIGMVGASAPLIAAGGLAFSAAGRTAVVLAVLLLLFGYSAAGPTTGKKAPGRALVVPFLVALGTVAAISWTRELGGNDYYGVETSEVGRLVPEPARRVLTSLYMYAAFPPIVFSKYLEEGGEHGRWGENTLGPIRNGLNRMGFAIAPIESRYQRVYYIPYGMNVGTMLRELHADFGEVGLILFPFLLGALATASYWLARRGSLIGAVVGAHLSVVAALSTFMNAMRWGDWWASLVFGVTTALVLTVVAPRRAGWLVWRSKWTHRNG